MFINSKDRKTNSIKIKLREEVTMEDNEMLDGCGNKLMDQKEVAEFLHIAEKTLEHYRWKGMGPRYVKIGKLVRYRKCDVIEFVKALIKIEDEIKKEQQER